MGSDITTELAYLTRELKTDPCVAHALALRAAWALGNYHRFFRLYCHAPCMSGYLVDKFADRERKAALKAMIKTYVPLGSLAFSLLCSLLPARGPQAPVPHLSSSLLHTHSTFYFSFPFQTPSSWSFSVSVFYLLCLTDPGSLSTLAALFLLFTITVTLAGLQLVSGLRPLPVRSLSNIFILFLISGLLL